MIIPAEVAHLVEHDLAKVGVAGSSPVFRSKSFRQPAEGFFLQGGPGGGIGRHAGLKILWPARAVTVQLRSGALIINQLERSHYAAFLIFMEFANNLQTCPGLNFEIQFCKHFQERKNSHKDNSLMEK